MFIYHGVKTVPPVGLKQGDGCIACHRKKAGVKQAGLVVLSAWVFCSAGILLSENADPFDHRIFEGSSPQKKSSIQKIQKVSTWWLNHPFEKYERKSNWIISPNIRG